MAGKRFIRLFASHKMSCQRLLYFAFIVFGIVLADGEVAGNSTTVAPPLNLTTSPHQQELQKDAPTTTSTTHEPDLGLHGIIEQQLNLKFYNFICSKHYHLDCKITETLQVCQKGDYVAVLGLPLRFAAGSEEVKKLNKWIKTCDRNDQELNRETMKIIRKQIRIQNDNDWNNVFNSSSTLRYFWIVVGFSMFLFI